MHSVMYGSAINVCSRFIIPKKKLWCLSIHILYILGSLLNIIVSSLVLTFVIIVLYDSSEQTWTISFTCKGARGGGGQEFANYSINRDQLTCVNLLKMKLNLGYSARDFVYYKRRCGNAATLNEIEYDDDANAMVACNE